MEAHGTAGDGGGLIGTDVYGGHRSGSGSLSWTEVTLLYAQGALMAWIAHMYGRAYGALGTDVNVSGVTVKRQDKD
jgi:hypothetical protein